MPDNMDFCIYLLEHYAFHKNRSECNVLTEWDARDCCVPVPPRPFPRFVADYSQVVSKT